MLTKIQYCSEDCWIIYKGRRESSLCIFIWDLDKSIWREGVSSNLFVKASFIKSQEKSHASGIKSFSHDLVTWGIWRPGKRMCNPLDPCFWGILNKEKIDGSIQVCYENFCDKCESVLSRIRNFHVEVNNLLIRIGIKFLSDRRDSYRKERAPPVLYTNRLSSTLSADGLSRCRGSIDRTSSFSSRDEVFEEENKYWSLKIKELESYDGWDKQYILGRGENAK